MGMADTLDLVTLLICNSKLSMKSYVLAFSHILPCRKNNLVQPKVII